MKLPLGKSLALGLLLLSGCASWQGQVAYPNTRFASLPEFEPAAIPKDTQGNESIGPGPSTVATNPGKGAFVPVLGQVVFGSNHLHLMLTKRDFFNWQDRSKFITVHPAFTSGTWDNAVTGVVSNGSADLSKTVGVKLSAGDKGIPLGGGKAITLKLGVDGSLKLSKARVARLNLGNLDYVRALADAASDKEAYFVGEVLVCDVNASDLVGFNLAYADPGNPAFNPTLKADYEQNYSGVGLVLGAAFNKLSAAGRVSFNDLPTSNKSNLDGAAAAISVAPPQLLQQINALKRTLKATGVNNPDIVLERPFTMKKDASGNVIILPYNPFMAGTEVLLVDKTLLAGAKATLADIGEYQIQYAVVSGNTLYALRTTVELKQGADGKEAKETVANRDVAYLRWEAVDPASIK